MICPKCGRHPEIAKFCLACPTPLTTAPEHGFEERKVVTVLFVAGDVLNARSRVQGAAPLGSVVVGDTYATTDRLFGYEPTGLGGKTVE